MQEDRTNFRRQVFYISGFDPRGAAFLHGTCKRETVKWSEITGHSITTGSRQRNGTLANRWDIDAVYPQGRVESRFEFLQWDDIIRTHWPRGEAGTAWRSFRLLAWLVLRGVYGRAVRESWPFAVTLLATSGPTLIALAITFLCLAAVAILTFVPHWQGWAGASVCFTLAAALGLWGYRNLERFKPEWTSRISLFARSFALGEVKGVHERLDEMADHIIATTDANAAEDVLVIGHSFGTAMAALVAARVLKRRPDLGDPGSKVALITLGQIHSFVAHMPDAAWFREELAFLARYPAFNWFDFSSPPDGACYALVNVLDFLPEPPENLPRLFNAQFHKTFSSECLEKARRHRMEMHFLYLKSPDHPQLDTNVYDFVALIAGPVSAAQRFGKRVSGKPFFKRQIA